jgi:hypothetical protein
LTRPAIYRNERGGGVIMDDAALYVKRAGERVLASCRWYLEKKLKLQEQSFVQKYATYFRGFSKDVETFRATRMSAPPPNTLESQQIRAVHSASRSLHFGRLTWQASPRAALRLPQNRREGTRARRSRCGIIQNYVIREFLSLFTGKSGVTG